MISWDVQRRSYIRNQSPERELTMRWSTIRSFAAYTMATLGIATVLLIAIGTIADVRAFDRTSGGYEPPYTDYTGEPIDWDTAFVTPEGMYRPGYVLDTHVDCTTGMISFEFYGLGFDFRELSPRALAVHEPREACQEHGFDPDF